MEDILEESARVVEEVCEKFNYDQEDKEGNESLRTVLLKAVPALLADSKKEDRELFYQMLSHTPIVITGNLTKEDYASLVEEYIGDVSPHIKEEDLDLGEYGKNVGAGAYVSDPIMDENMQVKGKKSFIYIQRVSGRQKEFFGTDINVSHLEHELGHAWHAEKDQYVMKDGILTERVGTAEFKYSFSQDEDGKYIRKHESTTGLMIEEGMNTIAEEKAMANYMGISREEMKKAYREVLVKSDYQGMMSECVEHLVNKTSKQDLEDWRLYGNQGSKDKIEKWMEKTEFWKNRELDILPDSDSERNYNKKKEVLSRLDDSKAKGFFQEYEDVYFPDISQMTPFEKLENALEQFYDLKDIKYRMGTENYSALMERICWESYCLINQTAEIKAKEEIMQSVGMLNASDVNQVTLETKQGVKKLRREENERQGERRE